MTEIVRGDPSVLNRVENNKPGTEGAATSCGTHADDAPCGLMVDLQDHGMTASILDAVPEFGWITRSRVAGDSQSAYRILVGNDPDAVSKGTAATFWDSGVVPGVNSIRIPYSGKPLLPGETGFWKVKTWRRFAGESPWSEVRSFRYVVGEKRDNFRVPRLPLLREEQEPVAIRSLAAGHVLVDFGKVAFGFLKLAMKGTGDASIRVHFGERGDRDGVNRVPGGSVRYYRVDVPVGKGEAVYTVHPPRDDRNTTGQAVRLPAEIGVVAPFRYVELENVLAGGWEARRIAVHYPFTRTASFFHSSDKTLNDIWELCKYSIEATSFCGVYVDGDRERIPYEADAYINQLSHYAVDREYSLARFSHEYLLRHSTWPTEWKQHSILIAREDFFYTGSLKSLRRNYELLKREKTLEGYAGPDGLLNTGNLRDIVDWPAGERDGYDMREINTVVNAFYCRTLEIMSELAGFLGRTGDARTYREKFLRVREAFNATLYDEERGLYRDGAGSDHASLHANMMPLAFDLVPGERRSRVGDYVVSRGMACSVYGAQYLLEALYKTGRADAALALMTSRKLRGWQNMLRVGSTITLEAWDDRFKPNQDWNHAWGSAPANIIVRYLLGVRPIQPGFGEVLIQPRPGTLRTASARVPTMRGPIELSFENPPGEAFSLRISLPVNMTARVELPRGEFSSSGLEVDGEPVEAEADGDRLIAKGIGAGEHIVRSGR